MILLDLDGVIMDFQGHAAQAFGYNWSSDNWPVMGAYDMIPLIGCTSEHFWGRLNGDEEFWRSMPRLPWADFVLGACREHSRTIACTFPGKCPSSASGKAASIAELGFGYDYFMTPLKHMLAPSGALLIDDNDDNVAAYEAAGGRAFLFPQPWNKRWRQADERIPLLISWLGAQRPARDLGLGAKHT